MLKLLYLGAWQKRRVFWKIEKSRAGSLFSRVIAVADWISPRGGNASSIVPLPSLQLVCLFEHTGPSLLPRVSRIWDAARRATQLALPREKYRKDEDFKIRGIIEGCQWFWAVERKQPRFSRTAFVARCGHYHLCPFQHLRCLISARWLGDSLRWKKPTRISQEKNLRALRALSLNYVVPRDATMAEQTSQANT